MSCWSCSRPRASCRPGTRPGGGTPGPTLPAPDLVVLGDCNPDVLVLGDDVTPAFGQQEKLVASMSLVIGGLVNAMILLQAGPLVDKLLGRKSA